MEAKATFPRVLALGSEEAVLGSGALVTSLRFFSMLDAAGGGAPLRCAHRRRKLGRRWHGGVFYRILGRLVFRDNVHTLIGILNTVGFSITIRGRYMIILKLKVARQSGGKDQVPKPPERWNTPR